MAVRRTLVLAVALVAIVTGCGTVPVTPLPSAPIITPTSAASHRLPRHLLTPGSPSTSHNRRS